MPRLRSFLPLAALVVAGCAVKPPALVLQPSPAPVVAFARPFAPVPPPVSATNANLSPAGTVWHLRAALNVAALACRGPNETAIIAGYNALLARAKAPLAAAEASYSGEYQAGGGDWRDRYDDEMTRLYNFFSRAPARDRFCTAATAVLADTATLDPAALTAFATQRLPELDRAFAEPVPLPRWQPLPVAMAMATPVSAVPRIAAPVARPRLDLDPSVFRTP